MNAIRTERYKTIEVSAAEIWELLKGRGLISVTPQSGVFERQISWLSECTTDFKQVDTLNDVQNMVMDQPDHWGGVVINLDVLPAGTNLVETCISIRSMAPGLAVVLSSQHFFCRSFEARPNSISDACVREPLSRSALLGALRAGLVSKSAAN